MAPMPTRAATERRCWTLLSEDSAVTVKLRVELRSAILESVCIRD